MKTFYVPYYLVKYMTLKQGNVYRHNLSFRLYLYLTHFHNGRIKWNKRNHLVKSFTSSHTAVKKALFYLEKEGLIQIKNNWIECKGHKQLKHVLNKSVNFNVKFQFTDDLLFDRKSFTNHLFTIIFQSSAMIRGEKKEDCINPLMKIKTDEFIQMQSSSYVSVMTERHRNTAYRRLKSIRNFKTKYCQRNQRQGLTEAGYIPKEKSPLIASHSKEELKERLKILKQNNPELNGSYVMKTRHMSYIITKNPSTKYGFYIPTKSRKDRFKINTEPWNGSIFDYYNNPVTKEVEEILPSYDDAFNVELPF